MKVNEFVRRTLLLQLESAYPVSLPIETLKQGVFLHGLPANRRLLEKELAYLQDKGFVLRLSNDICPQAYRYKLSAQGIDFLENEKRDPSRI